MFAGRAGDHHMCDRVGLDRQTCGEIVEQHNNTCDRVFDGNVNWTCDVVAYMCLCDMFVALLGHASLLGHWLKFAMVCNSKKCEIIMRHIQVFLEEL